MIDTTVLRERILDMAIRGKLVPQDPNDEPASVLLERIREEKKQLVKEGKLKKKDLKDDTIIFRGEDNLHYEKFADDSVKCIEAEIPFELPKGWAWTRLGNLSMGIQYGLSNSAKTQGTHKLLRITDIQDGKVNWNTVPFTTVDDPETYLLKTGDIVFARTGATVGKSFLITEIPYPSVYASYLIRIRLLENLLPEYIYQFFDSTCYWSQITDKSVGVGQPNCNGTSLKELFIPIPPINEQLRIVPTAQALLAYVTRIDGEKKSLLSIAVAAKAKILDFAIRGQLVPQDPADEPASALLERIRAEKEELIKQGKIKRDKKESVIFKGEDNSYYRLDSNNKRNIIDIPFDIPDNWEWCNLSMIGSTNIGLTYKPADIVTEGTMVLRSSNIINGKLDLSDLVRVNTTIRENQYIQKNDILICARNGSKALVGKCAIFENVNEKASFGAFMAVYRSSFFKYVYYFLNSDFFRNTFSNDDSKQINQLTQDMIKNTTIPLPPFAEQKRIVEAIETAFAQLDIITHSIS